MRVNPFQPFIDQSTAGFPLWSASCDLTDLIEEEVTADALDEVRQGDTLLDPLSRPPDALEDVPCCPAPSKHSPHKQTPDTPFSSPQLTAARRSPASLGEEQEEPVIPDDDASTTASRDGISPLSMDFMPTDAPMSPLLVSPSRSIRSVAGRSFMRSTTASKLRASGSPTNSQTTASTPALSSSPSAVKLPNALKQLGRDVIVVNLACLLQPHLLVDCSASSSAPSGGDALLNVLEVFNASPSNEHISSTISAIAQCLGIIVANYLSKCAGKYSSLAVAIVTVADTTTTLVWLSFNSTGRIEAQSQGCVLFANKSAVGSYQQEDACMLLDGALCDVAEQHVMLVLQQLALSWEQRRAGQQQFDACSVIIQSTRVSPLACACTVHP